MFLKFFNAKPETGCPPPSRTDEIQPPQIDPDDQADDPPTDDPPTPDPSTSSDPEEDKRSKFERGIDAAMAVLDLFNRLPKKQKQLLMDSAKVVSAPSPKK